MTDLITRLRSRLWQHQGDVNHWKLRDEAADELERLRAAAQQARAAMSAMLTHLGMDEDAWNRATFNQARDALRALDAALEGK